MSNSSTAAEIQLISDGLVANYLTWTGLCLLVYDTILTLPDEIEFIWNQSIRLGTFLYVSARYGLLCNLTLLFAIDVGTTITSSQCTALNFTGNLALLLYLLGTQGLSLGRAYAVAPDWKLVMIVLSIFLVLIQFIQITEAVLAWSCNQGFSGPKARAYNYLNLASNILTVLFEAGVLIVTASKVWGLYRLEKSSKAETDRLSLGALCLHQSVLRFAVILLFGVEQAISLNLSRFRLGGVEINIEFALSAMLVCRFLLQLRRRHKVASEELATASMSRFDARIRDIGNSIIDEFGDTDSEYSTTIGSRSTDDPDAVELEPCSLIRSNH